MYTHVRSRHGLSYTTFQYQGLHVTSSSATLTVTNTGSLPGAEVVQLYIGADKTTASIARPEKELKGFKKFSLQPGETASVEIPFDRFTTAFWDEELKCWVCEKGVYSVLVGSSSQAVKLKGELLLEETTTWVGL